jgi:hypothetical protein
MKSEDVEYDMNRKIPGTKGKSKRLKFKPGDLKEIVKKRAYHTYEKTVVSNAPDDEMSDWFHEEEERIHNNILD